MIWVAPIRALEMLAAQEAEQETQRFIRAKVHATVLVLRRAGRLDTANRVSEWQHCLERGYAPTTLPGFPDDPKREIPEE